MKKRLILPVLSMVLLSYGVAIWIMNDIPAPIISPNVGEAPPVIGVVTSRNMSIAMQSQLNTRGGWLPNDLPGGPGYFLDNLPNFQLGVLMVLRHSSRIMRDQLTRLRTSDAVQKETDLAYSAFANEPTRWLFPSAESAFSRGANALENYAVLLEKGEAPFYPRADNLVELLRPLSSELGAVNTRLLSVSQGGWGEWLAADDEFYLARGVGYGSLAIMQAVQVDFKQVLQDKKGEELVQTIIDTLQSSHFDPLLITNGNKSGLLANHVSNLRVFLDEARQKINSLITVLREG